MVTISASVALAQNGYTTDDVEDIACEYIIDAAIDHVNLMADTSIAALAGVAGAKTGAVTRNQNAALQPLITLMLRDYKRSALSSSQHTTQSTGAGGSSSFTLGPYSVSESSSTASAISAANSLNNAANTYTVKMFETAIARLRGRLFSIV